jgi:hypothetical protein
MKKQTTTSLVVMMKMSLRCSMRMPSLRAWRNIFRCSVMDAVEVMCALSNGLCTSAVVQFWRSGVYSSTQAELPSSLPKVVNKVQVVEENDDQLPPPPLLVSKLLAMLQQWTMIISLMMTKNKAKIWAKMLKMMFKLVVPTFVDVDVAVEDRDRLIFASHLLLSKVITYQ